MTFDAEVIASFVGSLIEVVSKNRNREERFVFLAFDS